MSSNNIFTKNLPDINDVKIGFSCADIAFNVQENIKRSIESMTNLKTGTINVNILGVSFDDANIN